MTSSSRQLVRTCLLTGLVCILSLVARAQESGEFRTVFGGFGVKLPEKYSEYCRDAKGYARPNHAVVIAVNSQANDIVGQIGTEVEPVTLARLDSYRASLQLSCWTVEGFAMRIAGMRVRTDGVHIATTAGPWIAPWLFPTLRTVTGY